MEHKAHTPTIDYVSKSREHRGKVHAGKHARRPHGAMRGKNWKTSGSDCTGDTSTTKGQNGDPS